MVTAVKHSTNHKKSTDIISMIVGTYKPTLRIIHNNINIVWGKGWGRLYCSYPAQVFH